MAAGAKARLRERRGMDVGDDAHSRQAIERRGEIERPPVPVGSTAHLSVAIDHLGDPDANGRGVRAQLASQGRDVGQHGSAAASGIGGLFDAIGNRSGLDIDATSSQLGAAGIDPDDRRHGRNEGATPKTRRQVSPPTLRMS